MTIQLQYQLPPGGTHEYDLVNDNGIQQDFTLETAVIMSLFTDARATAEELLVAGLPKDHFGGWWGDSFPEVDGDVLGSKLWLLTRAKRTDATLALGQKYAEESLQWMLDDEVAESVDVTPSWYEVARKGILILAVDIQRPGELEPRWRRVWEAISGAPVES